MKIVRAGQVVYDQLVGGPCRDICEPSEGGLTGRPVGLRDLDRDGEREVVVALFSGGASCCVWAIAYGFEPDTNSYKRSALDTGSGYVARDYDADGALELVGGDRRYRGVFACGACGAQPIRIWQYSSLSFTDETRAFPGRVKDHVRSLLRLYPRVRARGPADLVRGVLTPYVADLCLLGRCRAGLRVVQRARRRGELDRTGRGFEYGPFGVDYVRRLKRFLRRTGYLR